MLTRVIGTGGYQGEPADLGLRWKALGVCGAGVNWDRAPGMSGEAECFTKSSGVMSPGLILEDESSENSSLPCPVR